MSLISFLGRIFPYKKRYGKFWLRELTVDSCDFLHVNRALRIPVAKQTLVDGAYRGRSPAVFRAHVPGAVERAGPVCVHPFLKAGE